MGKLRSINKLSNAIVVINMTKSLEIIWQSSSKIETVTSLFRILIFLFETLHYNTGVI